MRSARKPPREPAEQRAEARRRQATPDGSETSGGPRRVKRLPEPSDAASTADLDRAVREALAAAGLLGSPPDDSDLPTDPAEIEAMMEEDEAWILATFTQPLGLAEAVIEDRR